MSIGHRPTYLCVNLAFHSHIKHIVIDFHFVHHNIQSGELLVSHVFSSYLLADTLIEPLCC